MLTIAEIRQLSDKDLIEEIAKASKKLLKLKFDLAGGYTKELHSKQSLKKYIARLKTIQHDNQKEQSQKADSIPAQ